MKIRNLEITARGWPWQRIDGLKCHWAHGLDGSVGERFGWNPFSVKGMGRFGGGWAFKLGVTMSSGLRNVIFDLGLGSIRIDYRSRS